MSYREYLLWMEKFKRDWNAPSRTDYYLMKLIAVTARSKSSLDKMKIPFTFKNTASSQSTMTVEEATAASKARWRARMGAK